MRSMKLGFARENEGSHQEDFDAVIIAAPFQFSNITLASSINKPEEIRYIQLHVTLFTSPRRLSPLYFGRKLGETVPEVILTTTPEDVSKEESEFLSISTLRKITNPESSREEYAYKIFSKAPLDSALLSKLLDFEDPQLPLSELTKTGAPISWIYEKIWYSYPYLKPREAFSELRLDTNVYYTSGIESFISTMETSSLMGQNVARLIADSLLDRNSPLEQHFIHTEI